MKKILFSVAMVAMVASCAKNEVADVPSTNVIGFSTLNDRVVAKSATDLTGESAEDYAVYAISGDNDAVWFISDVITGTSDFAQNGPYYWPTSGAQVDFYAYAPSGCATVTASPTDDLAISLEYTVPTGAQQDFTVATPVSSVDDDENDYLSSVDFTFNHMLAKVSVQIALTEDFAKNYEISEEGTEFADLDAIQALLTAAGDDVTDPANVEATSQYYVSAYTLDAPFTATLTPVYDTFTVSALDAEPATTSTGSTVSHSGYTSFYIAPQAFDGCKLQINGITVRNNETGATFFPGGVGVNLTELTLSGNEVSQQKAEDLGDGEEIANADAFVAGTHYVFTVYIDGSSTEEDQDPAVQILFTATTAGWGDAVAGVITQI